MIDAWFGFVLTHGLVLFAGGASHRLEVIRVERTEQRGAERMPQRAWISARFAESVPEHDLTVALQEVWQSYDDGAFAVADTLQARLLPDLRVTLHDGRELSLVVAAISPTMELELLAEEPSA